MSGATCTSASDEGDPKNLRGVMCGELFRELTSEADHLRIAALDESRFQFLRFLDSVNIQSIERIAYAGEDDGRRKEARMFAEDVLGEMRLYVRTR